MKRAVLILLFLVAGIVFSGCDVTPGAMTIDCYGFTATNWTVDNQTTGIFSVNASAYDTKGKILDTHLGDLDPGVHSGLSGHVGWSRQAAPGQIVLLIGSNSYYGQCGSSTAKANVPLFTDNRINSDANATTVGYCTSDHGVTVYGENSGKFYLLGTVTKQQITAGLAQAASSGKHVLLLQASGQQVWALTSGELQFHSANGVKYDYVFPGNRCG